MLPLILGVGAVLGFSWMKSSMETPVGPRFADMILDDLMLAKVPDEATLQHLAYTAAQWSNYGNASIAEMYLHRALQIADTDAKKKWVAEIVQYYADPSASRINRLLWPYHHSMAERVPDKSAKDAAINPAGTKGAALPGDAQKAPEPGEAQKAPVVGET